MIAVTVAVCSWGGGELDVIEDTEEIRDELLKILYGVWDHLKNGGDHGAENYVLDWVQFLFTKTETLLNMTLRR